MLSQPYALEGTVLPGVPGEERFIAPTPARHRGASAPSGPAAPVDRLLGTSRLLG